MGEEVDGSYTVSLLILPPPFSFSYYYTTITCCPHGFSFIYTTTVGVWFVPGFGVWSGSGRSAWFGFLLSLLGACTGLVWLA